MLIDGSATADSRASAPDCPAHVGGSHVARVLGRAIRARLGERARQIHIAHGGWGTAAGSLRAVRGRARNGRAPGFRPCGIRPRWWCERCVAWFRRIGICRVARGSGDIRSGRLTRAHPHRYGLAARHRRGIREDADRPRTVLSTAFARTIRRRHDIREVTQVLAPMAGKRDGSSNALTAPTCSDHRRPHPITVDYLAVQRDELGPRLNKEVRVLQRAS